jgi:anti-anti-sigma factor
MVVKPDDPGPMRLRVESDVDRLAEVREFIRTAVARLGGSRRIADDLVQAVDEATCNIMLHGYGHEPGAIEIEAARRDGNIEIRLLDRSPAFDPTTAPSRDTGEPPVSKRPGGMGFGIHLLRTMTDAVHHSVRPDGGNELTLVRSIDEPAEEEGSMALTIDVVGVGGSPPVTVVALGGELDASNYEQVIDAVRTAYAEGARGLVFDLSGLTFMASSGLFALHSAVRIMRGETPPDPEGGWGALHEVSHDHDTQAANVRIAGAREAIARVLERTGMSRLFGLDANRADAIAALQGA